MALTIDDDLISGDRTRHTARPILGHPHAWEVSWLPGRLLTRNAAITAMVLADVAGSPDAQPGSRLWPHVQGWAAELGLTAPDALTRITPPSASAGNNGLVRADPEAGQ